ncbi:TIGR02281 family clan AA aspartic protease [Brevundimonas sp. S30B]|uniref:retropepsin-like aspartic protease family protein n=1 Tax=unclassified Brevundimonas TaxID=2622653 RepID=UPI001072155B|nr:MULTISPECIES: TIGR02281 family clan AA aspartic protease [unclassified Brevundimonas]QBX37318.1 TIGR02281 family clan AA aspartic protease [Brevundimonas sp. MF30-B]TFW03889.1 TIGR02281 family clan AA aspartic protease [Brevundimonas sp. S30B]
MFRFDPRSLSVGALALAAALTTAFWLDRMDGSAQAAEPAARVARADDGHYWARASIEGQPIDLMVDTGSSLVVLTRQDAERLGYRLDEADYSVRLSTAAGPVAAAPIRLAVVGVGSARVERVAALVAADGLPHSLLGMSYLGRLSSFEATPRDLTLRG